MLAFLTIVVSAAAVFISWQQWRVAQYRIKMDLYDRRLTFLRNLQALLRQFRTAHDVEEVSREYADLCAESGFLFDSDIEEYMIKSSISLLSLMATRETLVGMNINTDLAQSVQNFVNKTNKECIPLFRKYLEIREPTIYDDYAVVLAGFEAAKEKLMNWKHG